MVALGFPWWFSHGFHDDFVRVENHHGNPNEIIMEIMWKPSWKPQRNHHGNHVKTIMETPTKPWWKPQRNHDGNPNETMMETLTKPSWKPIMETHHGNPSFILSRFCMFNKNLNGNPKMKTLIETLMETSMLSFLKKKSLGSNWAHDLALRL